MQNRETWEMSKSASHNVASPFHTKGQPGGIDVAQQAKTQTTRTVNDLVSHVRVTSGCYIAANFSHCCQHLPSFLLLSKTAPRCLVHNVGTII